MSTNEPMILLRDVRACAVADQGVLVSIRRAPIGRGELDRSRRLAERAAAGRERIVMLIALRLDRRFRLEVGYEREIGALVETLRELDRRIAALATVLEFGGLRAGLMRASAHLVWALARPRCEHAMFDRVTDAVRWLEPRARAIGASDDVGVYLRAYQLAHAALAEIDGASNLA